MTETTSIESDLNDTMFIAAESLLGLTLILIFVLSIYNLKLQPPNKIFVTYESYLREEMEKYFNTLNKDLDDKLLFEISHNPVNALWIEIQILDKTLQMPYSDYEIQKHMNYLNRKAEADEDTDPITLFQYVLAHSGEKEFNEKIGSNSLSVVSIKSEEVEKQQSKNPPHVHPLSPEQQIIIKSSES